MNRPLHRIGVVASSLHESCQTLLWKGVLRSAKSHNIDLVTFVATSQDRSDNLDMHFHVIRDFVRNCHIDGIILFTGAIAEFTEPALLRKLLSEWSSIPMVSLSYEVAGVPSILADNTTGISDMIDHMVTQHGYQRIAFVRGPDGHMEAEQRFEAYRKALERLHVPFCPELVFEGTFSSHSGAAAVDSLIRRESLPDAILCADDETALGAIAELKRHHIHIPTKIAVTGYDDIDQASVLLPSLTTVQQPLGDMGALAVDTLLRHLRQEPVPQVTRVATRTIFRRSCGCFPSTIRESVPPVDPQFGKMSKEDLYRRISEKVGQVIGYDRISQTTQNSVDSALRSILNTFDQDTTNPDTKNRFLNALDTYLFQVEGIEGDIDSLHRILLEMTSFVNAMEHDSAKATIANTLLQQAQVLLREHRLRLTQTRNMEEIAFQLRIREVSQKLITTFDQSRLRQTILAEFPDIHIRRFVFAMYDVTGTLTNERWHFPEQARTVVAFDQTREICIDETSEPFPCSQLMPDQLIQADSPPLYPVFLPLFFKQEQFGYLLFEYQSNQPLFMFEEIRLHIGSALKSSLLMQDLKLQSMVDELTGLYNRRGFLTLSQKMIESTQQAGGKLLVFFADLDGLKRINDTHGHDAGDAAIVGAANILTDTFRRKDVIARIGGDEFTVILHIGDNAEPESRILLRMRDKIDDFNRYGGHPFQLSLSVGSSYFEPDGTESLEDILKEADNRMMAKKRKYYET